MPEAGFAFEPAILPAVPAVADQPAPLLLLIDDETMVGRFIGHAAEECARHDQV